MIKHLVILISGRQGSGKSSLADNLAYTFESKGLSTYRTRFAKVLYMMHDAVRDIGRKYGIPMPDKMGGFLQYLGTEEVRTKYGENAWVNCLKKEVSDLKERKFIIIDDCRFSNEVSSFDNSSNCDVFKVRLEASAEARKQRVNAWRDNETHPSETGLDDYKNWDLVINTDEIGELATLELAIKSLLKWADSLKV